MRMVICVKINHVSIYKLKWLFDLFVLRLVNVITFLKLYRPPPTSHMQSQKKNSTDQHITCICPVNRKRSSRFRNNIENECLYAHICEARMNAVYCHWLLLLAMNWWNGVCFVFVYTGPQHLAPNISGYMIENCLPDLPSLLNRQFYEPA